MKKTLICAFFLLLLFLLAPCALAGTLTLPDSLTVIEQVFAGHPAEFRSINEYEARTILTKLGITDFEPQKVLLVS